MATKTKKLSANDRAWTELFEKFSIPETVKTHGFFDITSEDIKSTKAKREPRLMCKMDFRQQVAKPFKDAGL